MCLVDWRAGCTSAGVGACIPVEGQPREGARLRWLHWAMPSPAIVWSLGLRAQWVQVTFRAVGGRRGCLRGDVCPAHARRMPGELPL